MRFEILSTLVVRGETQARANYRNNSINMANILMRVLITWMLLFYVVVPVDATRGFLVEGPTCTIASTLEALRRLRTLMRLYELAERLPKSRKRKARTKKRDLPYHKRRKRVKWHEWVRELGPDDFYTHHRMRRATFEKLLSKLGDSLYTETSKVRYGSGPVTPRMQLTMCLKFLGGDATHDIKKHMGGLFEVCVMCARSGHTTVTIAANVFVSQWLEAL